MLKKIMLYMFLATTAYAAVDFDASMELGKHDYKLLPYLETMLDVARKLYQKNNPDKVAPSEESMPNIVHHIWLGRPLSDDQKALRATWQKHHPDWQFVLWTDRVENDQRALVVNSWDALRDAINKPEHRFIVVDVSTLRLINRRYYDASPNFGEKSDILRYEIIYWIGGLYVDCDFECLGSFDGLHKCYDFYTGLQPLDTHFAQLGVGLFGAKPGHLILGRAIETIARDRVYRPIVVRTGPIHFSRAFIDCAGKNGTKDIAFPASFFYPCGYNQKGQDQKEWRKPESLAVHHWAGSWLEPEGFINKMHKKNI